MGPFAGHLVLHSLGLVVVFVLVLIARSISRHDPVAAHTTLRGVLLAVLLLPLLQLSLHGRWTTGAPEVRTMVRDFAERALPPTPAPSSSPASPVSSSAPAPAPAPSSPPAPSSLPALSPLPAPAPVSPSLLLPPDLLLLTTWLLGALLVLSLHLARLLRTRRLLAAARPVNDPARLETWRRASLGSRLTDRVRLLESRAVEAPACWGLVSPTIVLPTDGVRYRGGPTLEWALLHELVHLERNDPRDAIAQRLMTALFWFHPVAWWLSRELDRTREQSCDQLVVGRGGRRRSYALALLESATPEAAGLERLAPPAVAKTATGHLLSWSPTPSQLRRRIEMLTTRRTSLSPRRRLVFGVGAAVALSACWAGQLAIASTFDAGDEVLVARCDPKKKKGKKTPERFTAPPPTRAVERSSDSDIVQDEADRGAVPIRFDERDRSWVTPPSALDHEVRDSLVRTLLHDDSAEIRAAAAQTLSAHLGDEDVKKGFLRAIGDGCDKTRARLVDDLLTHETISPDMRDLLVRMFDSKGASRSALTHRIDPANAQPGAQLVLIGAVQDARDSVVQLSAAEALAPHVEDEKVRKALLRALKESSNEVARMAMIDALDPFVAEADVRSLFTWLIPRDDNPMAVQAMTESLAQHAADAGVRASMIEILLAGRNDLVKMKFADALTPHVHQPEVKRAFIQILPKLGSDVIRMRLVTALASLVDPTPTTTLPRPEGRTTTLPLPGPTSLTQKRG